MFSFTWSIDHAQFITDLSTWWNYINVYGIVGGLLNLACAAAIYNTVKHMGDDDREVDTSDPDIGVGMDE